MMADTTVGNGGNIFIINDRIIMITKMSKFKTTIIPVGLGALGIIKKGAENNMRKKFLDTSASQSHRR